MTLAHSVFRSCPHSGHFVNSGVQPLTFNPTWNSVDFISSNGNVFAVPEFFKAGLPDKPLVGELFIGGAGGFELLQSTVKTGIGWEQVRFAIFDMPGETFPQRLTVSMASRYAYVLPQTRCESAEHLAAFYADILATGGEGALLRIGSVLTKIKPRDDAEAVVIGHNASAQDHGIGSLTVRNERGTFKLAGLGFSMAGAKFSRSPSRLPPSSLAPVLRAAAAKSHGTIKSR